MTSENSFWAKFKRNNIQKLWIWIISLIEFIALFPATMVMYFNRVKHMYGGDLSSAINKKAFIQEMQEAICDCLGITNVVGIFIIAGIIAVGVFSYLNNKSKMDMLGSIPVSKKTMYLNDYINGLLIFAVPYLANLVIAFVIAASSGYMTGLAVQEMLLSIVLDCITFVIYYSLAILCISLTGNTFVSICLYGGISIIPSIFVSYISELAGIFFKTKPWEFNDQHFWFAPIVELLGDSYELKGFNDIGKTLSFLKWGFIIWIIMAVVHVILAYMAYMNRPSEALTKIVYSKWVQQVIKIVAGIMATIIVAKIAFDSSGQSNWVLVIGIIVAGIIIGMAAEAIFATDIRAAVKSLWSTGLIVLCSLCIFITIRFDIFRYDQYVPATSSVKSYAVDLSPDMYMEIYDLGVDSYGKLDYSNYANNIDYYQEYMKITNAEAVIRLAQKSIDNELYLRAEDDGDNVKTFHVLYRKAFGKTARRFFVDVNDEESIELLNEITSTREWKEGQFQLLTVKDELEKVEGIKITFNDGISTVTLNEDVGTVIDAFAKDIEMFNYKKGSEERPIGSLSISIDIITSYQVPVYSDFSNLMELIKKCPDYNEETITAEEIDSIRIMNYHNEYWDDPANTDYSADPAVSVVITDKDDIQEILNHANPASRNKVWNEYGSDADNYGIDVLISEDKGDYRKGDYINFKFDGEVPQWVVEETAIKQ